MEKQKSFWQQVREKHYAQGMSRPTEELVAEYNALQDSEIFFQSVTARLSAILDLFRFRGYDLSPLKQGERGVKLCRVKLEDGKVLPIS
jgi:hypothetical protein